MRFWAGRGNWALGLAWLACSCGGVAATEVGGTSGASAASSGSFNGGLAGALAGMSNANAAGSGGVAQPMSMAGGGAGGSPAPAAGRMRDFLADPRFPDSFWQPASDGESSVDRAPLEEALRVIESAGWELHAFLIAKNGRLVFERYGWDTGTNSAIPNQPAHQVLPNERMPQFSVTKSFLSALIGIAIADGALSGVQAHAVDFFPDYPMLNPSPEKASITLSDLLTMRSGLQFSEGDQTTFSAPDPARAMLMRSVVDTPVGTIWNYSSGGANIAAEILRVATGKTPLEYGNEKLFAPLGIDSPPWDAGRSGTNFGGFGLSLTAREMARFGELFRNSGSFQGKRIVPSEWVDASTAPRCTSAWGGQYGYLWWVPNLPGFFNALGSFGQMIYVSRERGLVIVFTAYLQNDVAKNNLERLVRDYVLPAAG